MPTIQITDPMVTKVQLHIVHPATIKHDELTTAIEDSFDKYFGAKDDIRVRGSSNIDGGMRLEIFVGDQK